MSDGLHELITWLGLVNTGNEMKFQDVHLKTQPDYWPWSEGRPHKDSGSYNCLVASLAAVVKNKSRALKFTNASIKDEACAFKSCTLCQIPKVSRKVQIRGLCKDSHYDTTYVYTVSSKGEPMYVGLTSSAIWYDFDNSQWVLTDRKDGSKFATSHSKLESLFLGVSEVNFQNISDVCVKDRESKHVTIKVTSCIKGNQFTCDDGNCILMDLRCDQIVNCADGSDEDNCKILYMNSNYNKIIPPFLYDAEGKKVIPVKVLLTLWILDILKVAEVDQVFKMKFIIIMEWYDHRLKFQNLKLERWGNALTFKEVKKLWIPYLIINSPKEEVTLATPKSEVTITREGNFTSTGLNIIEETNIFEGKENRLTFLMVYTVNFKCQFQLAMYPFDTQTCTANFLMKGIEEQSLMFVPKTVEMMSETLLAQYQVMSWKLTYRNASRPGSGILMTLKLKRRVVNELLTSYLPTTIILLIVYCTNYFKTSHFNTALTINLTSMLVLTTLFIGITNSLPRVAYMKVMNHHYTKKMLDFSCLLKMLESA